MSFRKKNVYPQHKKWFLDSDKYKYIKYDEKKHKGYESLFHRNFAPEHRINFSIKLGRPLRPHEAVHHLDRNRQNNKPENLEMYDSVRHLKSHIEEGHLRVFSKDYQPRWKRYGKWKNVPTYNTKVQKSRLLKKANEILSFFNDKTPGKKARIIDRGKLGIDFNNMPSNHFWLNSLGEKKLFEHLKEKKAGTIEKLIEDRIAPKKYINDVVRITKLPEKDVGIYVKNLKPHFFVSPTEFAEDVKDLHRLRSQYDILGSNEGLKNSQKHTKNLNTLYSAWIQRHNDIYKKYTGEDNKQFLGMADRFKEKVKKEKREMKFPKNAFDSIVQKIRLFKTAATPLPYVAGGALIGSSIPFFRYALQGKKEKDPEQKKNKFHKAIRNSLIMGMLGGVAGNTAYTMKDWMQRKGKHYGDIAINKKNDIAKSLIAGGITGSAMGSLPGMIDLLHAKDEESKTKATKNIVKGVMIGVGVGEFNTILNLMKKV